MIAIIFIFVMKMQLMLHFCKRYFYCFSFGGEASKLCLESFGSLSESQLTHPIDELLLRSYIARDHLENPGLETFKAVLGVAGVTWCWGSSWNLLYARFMPNSCTFSLALPLPCFNPQSRLMRKGPLFLF